MNIEIPKFEEFEGGLNEMAFKNPKTGRPYQKGDIVRVIKIDQWATETDYLRRHVEIEQPRGVDPDDAKFYMRVTDNSTKYMHGEMVFTNCSASWAGKLRMHGNNADLPGKEWNYIQPKFDEIKELANKNWFIHGDEEVFMDIEGNKVNLKQGNYQFKGRSLNFKLTREFKEPVLAINLERKESELFYVKLSDIKNLSSELTSTQYEAVADWFKENTGMEVTKDWKNFKVKQLFILIDEGSKEDFLYRSRAGKRYRKVLAGPFINIKQAEEQLEHFKKMEGATFYDKTKLIVDEKTSSSYSDTPDYISATLDELVAFVRANNVEVNMRDILTGKKAAVAFKNFGF